MREISSIFIDASHAKPAMKIAVMAVTSVKKIVMCAT
jgi:hypothetical protein